jgi:hypothetical protein
MSLYPKSIAALALVLAPQIAKADMNFIDRLLFSDKSYASQIEVKAYIITQEQACAALCDPPQEPIQLDKKELYGKKKYLFLQVRNTGKKHAWGTLACTVPSYHVPIKVPIFDIDNPKNYNIYLLHLGSLGFVRGETGVPKISVEWDALYTK